MGRGVRLWARRAAAVLARQAVQEPHDASVQVLLIRPPPPHSLLSTPADWRLPVQMSLAKNGKNFLICDCVSGIFHELFNLVQRHFFIDLLEHSCSLL